MRPMEPEDPAAEPCDFADEGCLLTVVGCCKETLPFYLWSEALLIDSFCSTAVRLFKQKQTPMTLQAAQF